MANREIKIREGKIQDLISIYKDTYKKLVSTIVDSTDAGKIQKARVMIRINRDLAQLGVDVDKWVKSEIPQYYLDGANVAIQDLQKLGVDLTKTSGLAPINREAIKALTDEVSLAFAEGIKGIGRNVARVLSDAQKQQINQILAQGKLTGDSRQMIAAAVEKRLRDEGLSVLVDTGGRRWEFDTYADMLVRTKAVEARNQGLTNRMLQNGYDLVQVSDHNSDHPACADWEGEILSLTGETPGYDTVSDAEASGLFHPNCEHAINVIVPSLAEQTQAYDNPYNYSAAAAD